MSTIAQLEHQIEAAFAGAAYPGDDDIVEHRDWESAEVAAAFKGRRWQELTLADVQQHRDTFLSPSGFRFYLPAYLLAALAPDSDLVLPFIVYSLELYDPVAEPDKAAAWNPGSLRRWEGLSAAQKNAVRAFLEYVRDERGNTHEREHAARALDRYWGR